ncbi:hypothetical protein [Pseudomonas brassicacearum]|uniref:Uncharacterized protein n=1 Tax=Pseudomonas brassicacearum TaxID=930166 RepID=A0A423GWZ8_9PSED|nr:hypothetical protein [Pseudomonas brassicacearum]RON02136.1 hypothetical protein BK658_07730 [Pseudomonas brassicacearum]
MPAPEYSLPDTLERIYNNQLALEAAIMELTLLVEQQGHAEAGENEGHTTAIMTSESYLQIYLSKDSMRCQYEGCFKHRSSAADRARLEGSPSQIAAFSVRGI